MATLKTDITADASQFLKVIKDVLKSAEQAQKAITDAFNENADIKIDDSGIKSAIDEVNRLEKELSGLSGGVKIDDSEVKKTQKELKDIDGTTLNVDVETSGLSGLTDAFSGALAGGVLGGGLAGLATAGLEAVVSGFSDAIALGNEFNTALGDLQAKTGATTEEMKELEQASKDAFLGGVGESVAEATQILGNTQIRLGDIFSTKEISDFTAQAQALATTFDLDVNEVVTKATPLIKQYGLSAQEAFETIAFSLQNGANAQDDILDSFAEYSQLAQEAGFSAQELGILISQAGEDGAFNTDKLVDSLKEAQIRINAGDYKDAFKGLKDGADEAQKGVISSVEAIIQKADSGELSIKDALALSTKEIEEAYDSGQISDAIRSQLQVAIAGTPAEDLGADLYAKAFGADIPQDVIDAQFQEAGASISNAIGQYTSFDAVTRQFELFITEVSQGLISFADTVIAPLIGGVIEIIGGVKDAFDSVFGDFELGGVTDELSGLLDVFNIIVNFLKDRVEATFRAVFGFIRSVIESVQDVFRPLIELVGELANSFGGAGSIFEDFGDIMKDVGDIIGLVGGLIFDLLITPLEFTVNILADVITEFLEFIGVLGETESSGSIVSDVLNFIKEALENIKGTIGGVVSAFDALKDALTSLDLGSIVSDLLSGKNPFEGITDQIEDAYDKGFNKATGKFEDALDDQVDANSKAYEQISKDIETLANNRANLSNKELANEKRKLQGIIDSNLEANELIKQDAIKLENQLGQIKVINPSSVEDAKVDIVDLSNFITDLLSKEPFKINTEFELSDIGIEDALDFFNNGTALTGDKDILAEINKELERVAELKESITETDQFIELQIEGKDQIISDLSSVRNENDKLLNQLEDRRLDLSQQIAFSNTDEQRNQLLKELDTLQDEIIAQTIKTSTKSNLTREELETLSNERIKKLRLESLEELNKEILDKEKALNDLKADFTTTSERDLQKLRLELADETNENLKQKEILQAEERFADLLNKFRDSEEAKLLIKQAYDDELRAIDKKYTVSVTSLYEDLAKTFAESISSYDPQSIIDKNKEVEDSISSVKSEYEAETEALNKQLKNRTIDYSEYNKEILRLETEKNEKLKELETERFGFVDIINDQLTESFKKLAENVKQTFAEQSQAVIGYQDKLTDYQKQLEDGTITELEYNELTTQAQKDKEKALTESYEAIAVASGATLASLIADGESFTTALAKTALEGLQALVPVFIAEIFGQSLGQLGPIAGPAVAGALTATLQGLIAVAQSSIGGANDGVIGLNESNKGKPKGNDSILMMLAPNESVITSSGTAKNKPYLEFINKGGSIADLINPNVYSSDMSETNKRIDETNRRLQGLESSFKHLRVDHFYDKQPKVFVNNKIELKSSRGVL
jgi:phage-related minor tail protein